MPAAVYVGIDVGCTMLTAAALPDGEDALPTVAKDTTGAPYFPACVFRPTGPGSRQHGDTAVLVGAAAAARATVDPSCAKVDVTRAAYSKADGAKAAYDQAEDVAALFTAVVKAAAASTPGGSAAFTVAALPACATEAAIDTVTTAVARVQALHGAVAAGLTTPVPHGPHMAVVAAPVAALLGAERDVLNALQQTDADVTDPGAVHPVLHIAVGAGSVETTVVDMRLAGFGERAPVPPSAALDPPQCLGFATAAAVGRAASVYDSSFASLGVRSAGMHFARGARAVADEVLAGALATFGAAGVEVTPLVRRKMTRECRSAVLAAATGSRTEALSYEHSGARPMRYEITPEVAARAARRLADDVASAVTAALATPQTAAGDVRVVLLTGPGSVFPSVRQRLSALLPAAAVVARPSDDATASGAALLARRLVALSRPPDDNPYAEPRSATSPAPVKPGAVSQPCGVLLQLQSGMWCVGLEPTVVFPATGALELHVPTGKAAVYLDGRLSGGTVSSDTPPRVQEPLDKDDDDESGKSSDVDGARAVRVTALLVAGDLHTVLADLGDVSLPLPPASLARSSTGSQSGDPPSGSTDATDGAPPLVPLRMKLRLDLFDISADPSVQRLVRQAVLDSTSHTHTTTTTTAPQNADHAVRLSVAACVDPPPRPAAANHDEDDDDEDEDEEDVGWSWSGSVAGILPCSLGDASTQQAPSSRPLELSDTDDDDI